MRARLQLPAVLAFTVVGCGDGSGGKRDGGATGDAIACGVLCFPDGSDAGVCPEPYVCVSESRTCPAGCTCSTYCFPRTPEGEQNCPAEPDLQCAAPDRTCPDGCEPVG
jgi:hypothetical protein